MKILGYILIFLNVIAAGAFVYLATSIVKQNARVDRCRLDGGVRVSGNLP